MEKKLTLVHPDEATGGRREFVAGQHGVSGIVRADGGYAVDMGTARYVFPDHRVSSYFEELRPGLLEEPENASKYGTQEGGRWTCARCGKGGYDTLHALKIHHGRSHG